MIESEFETPAITEVEALLLARESHSNRFQKKTFPPSINYLQSYVNPNSSSSQDCSSSSHGNYGRSSFSDRGVERLKELNQFSPMTMI